MIPRFLVLVVFASVLAVRPVHAVLPYFPGLQLGAWVSPPLVKSLREEEKAALRADAGERLASSARKLRTEIEVMHSALGDNADAAASDFQQALDDARRHEAEGVKARVSALASLSSKLSERLKDLDVGPKQSTQMPSPLNWGASRITVDPTASATSSLSWKVIDSAAIAKYKTGDTSAVDAEVDEALRGSATLSDSVASVQQALHKAYTGDTGITTTVLIIADVTHGGVKRLSPLRLDGLVALRGWNAMHPDDSIPDPSADRDAFREYVSNYQHADESTAVKGEAKERNSVFIVNEVHLGTGVVGIVHSKTAGPSKPEKGFRGTARESLFVPQALDDIVGTTSFTRESAEALLADAVGSDAGAFQFDIVCAGCSVTFQSHFSKLAVDAAAHVDPSTLAPKLPGPSSGKKLMALHAAQQSNARTVIDTILSSAAAAGAATPKDSIQWFLDCMSNAMEPPTSTSPSANAGVIVGFGVLELFKTDIVNANLRLVPLRRR